MNAIQARRLPETEGAVSLAVATKSGRLAYSKMLHDSDIFRAPLRGSQQSGAPAVFIGSTYEETNASYSPYGNKVVFVSNRSGEMEIWTADADGTHPVQLTFHKAYTGTPRWSPDSRTIAYDSTVSGRPEIYVVNADGGGQRQVTNGKTAAAVPAWSSDGKELYYRSTDSGREQIWKIRKEGGTPTQVTGNGASFALASPDGKYLYFKKGIFAPELWRWSIESGNEERVLEKVHFRSFALGTTGIWYVTSNASDFQLRFSAYAGGDSSALIKFKAPPLIGLSVSPDERWAIVSQTVREGSDLMLIEGFR